jgi:hypothetical protein
MTRIRLRYRTLKLRALCWVLQRLRAGQFGAEWPLTWSTPDQGLRLVDSRWSASP